MRCYTINAGECDAGIHVAKGIRVGIRVGEEGRGRKLVCVPLPPQAILESDAKEGGSPNLLLECGGHGAALVLIKDHSGFRGGWYLRAARSAAEWDQLVDAADIAHEVDTALGWSTCEGYSAEDRRRLLEQERLTCPACMAVLSIPSEQPHNLTIAAEGFCAQGDAGRMGGGPEYLVRMHDGEAAEIVRHGRLYGHPSVIQIACEAGVVTATDPIAAARSRQAARRMSI